MQLTGMDLSEQRYDAVAEDRMGSTERSRTSTAVLLWIGMAAVNILCLFIWLHLLRHGYAERR
jgi:hypothetical protein